MGWELVDTGWFCESCYGVASEGDFNISVFEQVGDFAYVWEGKGEGCPLCVISSVYGGCSMCCIWYFTLWSRVVGNLLFFAMWQTILNIEKNNKFLTTLFHKVKHQIKHKIMPPSSQMHSLLPCLQQLTISNQGYVQ